MMILATTSSWAIVTNTGVYETTDNVSAANWSTGWTGAGVNGWDYVGNLGGAGTGGGVYLGNGWVITAAHVGAGSGTFVLDGVSYTVNTSTEHQIGTADLVMFQISSASGLPNLASLTLAPTTPALSTQVVMIGYGGGSATGAAAADPKVPGHNGFNVNGATGTGVESWGVSSVTVADASTSLNSYTSLDYRTTFSTSTLTSSAVVQGGDSGGGVFVYDTATKKWELSGILELLYSYTGQTYSVDSGDESGIIDLSQYAAQINALEATNPVETPEPGATALFGLGLVGCAFALRRRGIFATA